MELISQFATGFVLGYIAGIVGEYMCKLIKHLKP
jgi:H+/Cl- antiporter ClcA